MNIVEAFQQVLSDREGLTGRRRKRRFRGLAVIDAHVNVGSIHFGVIEQINGFRHEVGANRHGSTVVKDNHGNMLGQQVYEIFGWFLPFQTSVAVLARRYSNGIWQEREGKGQLNGNVRLIARNIDRLVFLANVPFGKDAIVSWHMNGRHANIHPAQIFGPFNEALVVLVELGQHGSNLLRVLIVARFQILVGFLLKFGKGKKTVQQKA